MGVRRQGVLPAWRGFVLAALGLLVLVVSFFLPPLYVVSCVASCAQPKLYATAWAFSLTILANLPSSPFINISILALCYLPLLAAVMVVGCLLAFLVRAHRAIATWSYRAWLAGSVALVLLLLVVLFLISFFSGGPDKGFFGLLFGYGLLWVGNRIVRNSASSA
jgi:hypothetical protein